MKQNKCWYKIFYVTLGTLDDTSTPPMSILQRHTPQERDMQQPECIMEAYFMLSVGTPNSADPSSYYYLQIHLKSCHMFDDECSVFIFLQEIIEHSGDTRVKRWLAVLLLSIDIHLFPPGNKTLWQMLPRLVSGFIDDSMFAYFNLYIEKNMKVES